MTNKPFTLTDGQGNATLTMQLDTDSGYRMIEMHRIDDDQWSQIVAIATRRKTKTNTRKIEMVFPGRGAPSSVATNTQRATEND